MRLLTSYPLLALLLLLASCCPTQVLAPAPDLDGGVADAGHVAAVDAGPTPPPSPDLCAGAGDTCYDGPPGTQTCQGQAGAPGYYCGCHSGVYICTGTALKCIDEALPTPETCNGIDDDCDGIIDNVPNGFCYDGPAGTAGVGICHPGVTVCIAGQSYCQGEQVPEPLTCNGLDDACNGHPMTSTDPLDVVFVIDTNIGEPVGGGGPSQPDDPMGPEYQQVLGGVSQYAQQFGPDSGYRFAVVVAPAQLWDGGLVIEEVASDFVDGQTLATAVIPQLQAVVTDEGEPTWMVDVLLAIGSGGVPLSWRPGVRRRLAVFTSDEYESLHSSDSPLQLGQALAAAALPCSTWTVPEYEGDYLLVSQGSGGTAFPLTDSHTLTQNMNQALVVLCGESDGGQ